MVRVALSTTDHPLKRHPRNITRVSVLLSPLVVSDDPDKAADIHAGTSFKDVVSVPVPAVMSVSVVVAE
jgi:hypothetical protein